MNKIVGVTEFQRHFKRVIDEVVREKSPHILTRKSRPEAVLLPYEEYLRLAQLSASDITDRFSKVIARMQAVNAQYTDDEIESDLREATKMVRKAKRNNARSH